MKNTDGTWSQKLIPCKLNKTGAGGELLSIIDAAVRDIGSKTASCVTARYYKGIGANGDNMVIEVQDETEDNPDGSGDDPTGDWGGVRKN